MPKELSKAAYQYASRYGLIVREVLGSGIHGEVQIIQGGTAPGGTALKVFYAREFYQRELEAYERLRGFKVLEIRGFAVPQLIRSANDLPALEMTVVERPYVLDFAGAYLDDNAPQFSDEVWEAWEADKREKFGERWPEVKAVLAELEEYGVHLLDVNPGNVAFLD